MTWGALWAWQTAYELLGIGLNFCFYKATQKMVSYAGYSPDEQTEEDHGETCTKKK